jgi:aspartate aminotransferase-like enzyme
VEVDEWRLDVVLASSQKALAVPPGLTVFTLSERAAKQAAGVDNRGFYTDLIRYRDKHRAAARWERHRELQRLTAGWAEAHGFVYASAEGARSPTISCLKPPADTASPDLVQALAKKGFTIGGGYGEWKPTTLRIGHMGEVRERDLEGLFGAIEEVLESS